MRFMRLVPGLVIAAFMAAILAIWLPAQSSPETRPVAPQAVEMVYGGVSAFGDLPVSEFQPVAGWSFNYNVNPDIVVTSTVTGTVTTANSMAVLATGAGANQSAQISTVRALRYTPGQGGVARFTAIFTDCAEDSYQEIGLGDTVDGFFFGCDDNGQFGVMRRQNGTDFWTYQADWNQGDSTPMDDLLDITKGNVYQIKYQWLGYGSIRFYIENPDSGDFEMVHNIKYANSHTVPSIFNPTLPIMARVANLTNTTSITMQTPSAIAGIDGKVNGPEPIHPFTLYRTQKAGKTGITTETNIMTIRNNATFQSKTNRVRVRIEALSFFGEGTGSNTVTVQGIKNATLGGTPSYTEYSSNASVVSYDTAGTTVSGGDIVFSFELGREIGYVENLEAFGIELAPGETLTISVESASTIAPDLALTWLELF